MPHKDPDVHRAYQAALGRNKRAAKLEAEKNAHPLGPLGWEGDRLIAKWVRRGEYLLRKMILSQRWYAERKEDLAIYNRAYYAKNKIRIRTVNDRWAEDNKEANKAYKQRWTTANQPRLNVKSHLRRVAIRTAETTDFTVEQWQEIQEVFKHRCAYCNRKMKRLTMDHITPIAQGGSHTASNIVPACKSCNSRKHVGPPLSPVQPLLLTIALPQRGT